MGDDDLHTKLTQHPTVSKSSDPTRSSHTFCIALWDRSLNGSGESATVIGNTTP